MRVRYLTAAALGLLLTARAAVAQEPATAVATVSPSAEIALGDQAHEALHPAEALAHYERALSADSANYEALWKASRDAVDLAEFEPDKGKQTALFRKGEAYARRAIRANAGDAEGHFNLARALGKVALSLGPRDRVKYAKEVRSEALEALKLDPNHPGALHVMGRWNAEVMRLSGFTRFFAKNFLGGDVFNAANWKDAVSYMERSVAADPGRLVHHLDLAEIYEDVGDKAKAREQYQIVIDGRATDYNDPHYKQEAEQRLRKIT